MLFIYIGSKNQDLVCRIIFLTFYHKICCVHLKDLNQVGEMVLLSTFTSSFDRELCYSMGRHRREYHLGDNCIQNIRLWMVLLSTFTSSFDRELCYSMGRHRREYHLGDNCIQNIRLWRYIVGYTVENLVLRRW